MILTLGLLSNATNALASLSDPLTTIELDVPVHFLAPDGSDLLVEAGTYALEPAEEWIRVLSDERHNALLIEANIGTHELALEQPMAMSVSGETEDEADNHHLLLLLPSGESLEAAGTYSGIRGRGKGFFQKTFNRVKKTANKTYKKARSTAQKGKKHVQQSVKKGMTKAKKGMKHARKQIQKTGKQVTKHVRKTVQSARNAALHTKREIEKTGRRATSRLNRHVQKTRQSLMGGSGHTKFMKLARPFANPNVFSPPIGVDHDRKWGKNDLDCKSYQGLPFPACYDNHEGSDFMIDPVAMATGSVDVLAAAGGEVMNITNNHFDRCYFDPRLLEKKNKINCKGADPKKSLGNHVEILQDDGLYARYLHMKKGSVDSSLRVGKRVKCGQRLGTVASSGRSSAPHLHFDLHRDAKHEKIVDPYKQRLWISLDLKKVPNGRCARSR